VAVDRPDVFDPEVLEHRLRRDGVLDALLDRVQHLVQRRPDQRGAAQGLLDQVEDLLVAGVEPQVGQVVGEPADGRRVGAAVVVDDDDHGVLGAGDVVERLPAHAAGERAVADDGHHVPRLAAQRERLRQAVGIRQGRGGVRVFDDVVLTLTLARVAGEPAAAAQEVEAVLAAGDDLVHVCLVAGVEENPVLRRVEDAVQGEGQLDHAEVRAQMTAGARDLRDEEVADLRREHVELLGGQVAQITRGPDRAQQGRGLVLLCAHARRV
jgi:hypothetical protein